MVIIIVVLGVISVLNTDVDFLPDMDLPYVVVATVYAGQPAEIVEKEVTAVLEQALGSMSSVRSVSSMSYDNVSVISLQLDSGSDVDVAAEEIQGRIDGAALPNSAYLQESMVIKANPNMLPSMSVSVSRKGESVPDSSEYFAALADRIRAVDGVQDVSVQGLIDNYILLSLNDGVVVSMHASGQVALFGPVRLFYCLGLILAGFVADRKQRRLLPISTLFMQLFTILLPALLGNALYHSNMALMYFCSGFYVIFFTVSFLAFAPDTKDPALWASMGRAVRSLTTAIVVTPIPLLFARFGSLGMTALSCLLVAALLPVVWALPDGSQHRPLPEGQAHKPASREAHQIAFSEKYRLTPREQEVFARLISTEESIQQIAEGLYISRRTCQRHITAIYEKIGVRSRMGLYQLFVEEQGKP